MSINFDNLYPVFIKIAPENIVYFKSLLESYDGLIGVVRTLNKLTGEIVVLSVKETKVELDSFLETLKQEFEFYIIPPPENLSDDWLLRDS